tara:strand:- start:967 stop:1146 length:180 start_codon:yes stop_codon:yes gene_type:complete
MTHIERLANPVAITLPSGDWDIIQGLLTWEINHVRDDANRAAYLKTLEAMKHKIITENA